MALTKAAECAIRCGEPLFRAFLRQHEEIDKVRREVWESNRQSFGDEKWLYLRTKDDIAVAVRYLLDIDSRRELNTDIDAAARWSELNADFDMWRRGI